MKKYFHSNVIRNLIIINVIAYVISVFLPIFIKLFAIYPISDPNFIIWQPFTSMFLHGNLVHLLLNMIVLWSFGTQLYQMIGYKKFMILYFISGILSGGCWLLFGTGAAVGASGALCGLIGAYLIISPNTKVLLFFIIPMKIKYFIFGFGICSLIYAILQYINPSYGFGVGHIVHLGGLVIGYVLTLYWRNNSQLFKINCQ